MAAWSRAGARRPRRTTRPSSRPSKRHCRRRVRTAPERPRDPAFAPGRPARRQCAAAPALRCDRTNIAIHIRSHRMKGFLRGLAALLAVAALGVPSHDATAQDKHVLTTDREKVSYMIGMDVGNSLLPAGQEIDMTAFERAIRNAFEGGK